jgi:hypothetical protein
VNRVRCYTCYGAVASVRALMCIVCLRVFATVGPRIVACGALLVNFEYRTSTINVS